MNDWDNLDNFPTDDDDNDEFDWLDEDASAGDDDDDLRWLSDADDEPDEDDKPQEWQMPRSNRAERDIASQIEDAEDADFGDTEEGLDWMAEADAQDDGSDIPDWMAGMDVPSENEDGSVGEAWDLASDADDSDDADTRELDDDTWLVPSKDSDEDDVDSFLFDTSPLSDEDDEDDFLLNVSSADDSESDWGLASDDDNDASLFDTSASDDTDSGWGISLDDETEDDDADSFLFDTSPLSEDEDDLDSVLFDTSPLSDDADDFGEWGELGDSDIDENAFEPTSDDDDFDFEDFEDDSLEESVSEQDELGVPDWLSDMPLPDVIEPATSQNLPSASDDISVPDWLADADNEEIEEPIVASQNDDELDFMRDLDAPLPESDVDDIGIPDWLSDADNADIEEPVAEFESHDLNDLLGEDLSDDGEDLGDLLASLDADDDTNLDDLLASLDVEEDVELDDLFASLDMSSDEADADLDDLLLESDAEIEATDFDFSEPVVADDDLDDLDFLEPVSDTSGLDDLDFLEPVSGTSDLDNMDFLEAISENNSFTEIEADEVVLASEVDALDEAELDFLDDYVSDEVIASEIEDDEFATINQLNAMNTREIDDVEADFFQEDVEADFDFFDNLDDSEDVQEWFEEEKEKKPTTGSLSFLDNVPENADDPDWLDEISGIDTDTLREVVEKSKQPSSVDIDALIDSFGEDDSDNADNEILPAADLDAILDSMDEETRSQLPDDLPAEALPEWLQEIAKGTDGASAAALIRQRDDRSLDDLDDRLLELRERGLELSSTSTDVPENQERLSKIVPNIDEALTPAKADFGQAGLITAPTISPEQAQRATLLQGLVGSSLGATTGTDSQSRTRWLRAITSRADRIVISLLLIAGVFIPFVYSGFDGIGTLPQSEFPEDSDEFAAFSLIEDLTPSQYVLVAAEYGATGARELDTATRGFLEHIVSNGAIPVIVSSDAVGLLRAENIAVELLGEESRNQAYYIAGFLPGGNIGLRDFASNLNSIVRSDVQGNTTGLTLTSVDEFSAIILISESGETVRNWMEQVAPLTDTPIIVMTGQAARPLALPYTSSSDNIVALLTGYDDAYTYQQMALGLYNPSATPSPIASDTPTATDTPLPTATDLPTNTPTATPLPSDTPIPSLTPLPEAEPAETEEPTTDSPTDTPIPTVEAETATAELIEIAVVNSESPANVRVGSGSDFAVINSIEPGEELFIIERSTDEEWVRVILPDNSTGWIASILLTISEIPEDEFEGETTFDDNIQIGTVVADSRANVRAGAGSGFGAVAGLDPNTQVRIIGISEDGQWYNIVLPNGSEGWIASFLLEVEEIPEDEWEGASKDGFFPIYFDRPIQIQQGDDDDTLLIGRNAAGVAMPIFADADQSEILLELPNGAEFIVINEGDPLTQILMEDGQIGFIETRVIVTEERARSEVDFAPTPTSTPTIAPPTATFTPTVTFTPSPFAPQITPAPLTNPTARTSSQSFGLVIAIAVIALGNLFWIFRWLGQREQ